MNQALKELCREMGRKYCRLRKVSFSLNQRDPRLRYLLGQCVTETRLISQIPAGTKVNESDLRKSAPIQDNPLAALLGQNPIKASCLERFVDICRKVGLREALEDSSMHHPTVKEIGGYLFDRAAEKCLRNKYEGDDSPSPKRDSTLMSHLRQYRRLLEAPRCSGRTPQEKLQSARDNLPRNRRLRIKIVDGKVIESNYFDRVFLQPDIGRRCPNSLWQEIKAMCNVDRRVVQRNSRRVSQFEAWQQRRTPTLEAVKGYLWSEARGLSFHSWHAEVADLPYAIGASETLGAASLYRFIDEVRQFKEEHHIFWAFPIFLFCAFDRIRHLKLSEVGEGVFHSRQVIRMPQKQADSPLHHLRTSEMVLPVPSRLAKEAIKLLGQKRGFYRRRREALSWARKQFSITPGKLYTALTTVGVAIFDYPWILAHSGLHAVKGRLPSPRYYTGISAKFWPHLEKYYRLVDSEYVTPTITDAFYAGSGKVPLEHEVQSYFRTWRELLKREPHDGSPESLADIWNVIAAGAYQAFLLCTGLRPYKLPPPDLAEGTYFPGGEIYRQKSFVGVTAGPELLRLMRECLRKQKAYERLILSAGLCRRGAMCSGPFSMLHVMENSREFEYFDPSARNIAWANMISSEMYRFAEFYPGMIRHYTATKLREQGVPEIDARMYLGHHSKVISPYSAFRAEPAAHQECREDLSRMLGREVGLWD